MNLWLFVVILNLSLGHLFVGDPPPFQWNQEIDRLIMPMNGDPNHDGPGWRQQNFPCKGFHLKSPPQRPTVTWKAGSNVTFRLFDSTNTTGPSMHSPGAAHSGGSCQISFSYDNGQTWTVVQSWEGNCPRVQPGSEGQLTNVYDKNQDYTFNIPSTLPSSESLIVAWTWINASGNREFYMSCSPVRLESKNKNSTMPVGHPMLIANLKADPRVPDSSDWALKRCQVTHGVWIRFPDRYKGLNVPIKALALKPGSSIKAIDFNDSENFCGSDNSNLVKALSQVQGNVTKESGV